MTESKISSIVDRISSGNRYLISMKYSRTIIEIKVLDVGNSAVKILFPNSGIKEWMYKSVLDNEYDLIEELKD